MRTCITKRAATSSSPLPAGQSGEPQRQGSRVAREARAPTASARRWAKVRGSSSQTLWIREPMAWCSSAASGVDNRPHTLVVPESSLGSPMLKSRPRIDVRARLTALGSRRSTIASTAFSSLYFDNGPNRDAAAAISASTAASATGSVTSAVRLQMTPAA